MKSKYLSKILSFVLVLSVMFSSVPTAVFAADYDNHWAKDSIEKANQKGWMTGYSNGNFEPDATVTRAEFASMLWRALGEPAAKTGNPFTDVTSGDWYYEAVAALYAAEITSGYSATLFAPDTTLTREMGIAMLARAFELKAGEPELYKQFSDHGDVSPWAGEAISAMLEKNYVSGIGNNQFAPKRSLTRAETAVILAAVSGGTVAGDAGITITLTAAPTRNTAGNVTVSVSSEGGDDISFIGWRPAQKDASFTNRNGFTDITEAREFTVSANGWYAVFVSDSLGDNAYQLIEITNIGSAGSSGGGGGSGGSGGGGNDGDNGGSTFTKGEWIQLLAEQLQFDFTVDTDAINYSYADIEGSDHCIAIELAERHGILPAPDFAGFDDPEQDVPLFFPDETVTREFAAYTAVKAMGFVGEYDLVCSDLASVTYQNEAAIAIKQEFMSLRGNAFVPKGALTQSEADQILTVIDRLNASTEIDTANPQENITYAEGVVAEPLSDMTNYTVDFPEDGRIVTTLIKNAVTETIAAGDVFVLPANQDYIAGIALKAVAVTEKDDDTLEITCAAPKLEEIVSNIKYVGQATIDANNVVPAEGVTFEYEQPETFAAYATDINAGGSISLPGSLKFNLAGKKLSDDIKATGTVSIEIPDITCKVDATVGLLSGVELNELLISITEKIKITGKVELTAAETGYELTNSLGNTRWKGGRIELGRVPVAIGATGLSLDLVFFYNVNVKGEASISYTAVATQGIQVINGSTRVINDFSHSMDTLTLKGSAKMGVGLAVVLDAFHLIDLIGINGQTGLGITASFTPHPLLDPPLYCSEGNLYLYASLELDTETVFGQFIKTVFKASYSWDLWTEKNSPVKLKIHIENTGIVSECTYGTGHISGYVRSADEETAVNQARVSLYDGNSLMKTIYSDSAGKFDFGNINHGEFTLKVSATGYQTYVNTVKVDKNQTTYVQTLLMVDRTENGHSGSVSGEILDAVTGGKVSNVSYSVRENWDNVNGEIIAEGIAENGTYSIELNAGNYTVEFSKDNYSTTYTNIVISAGSDRTYLVVLSPETEGSLNGTVRFVLTWGATPRDLDSHLYGPTVDGDGTFHTYFATKTYKKNETTIAFLDRDDIDSYGPETTTVYELNAEGTYSFYVHDYTNRGRSNSSELSRSGAQVRVYSGNFLIATYNVPVNMSGTLWHVFDYDAATDRLTAVNTFSYSNTPGASRPGTASHLSASYSMTDKEALEQCLEAIHEMSDLPEEQLKLIEFAEQLAENPLASQEEVDTAAELLVEYVIKVL